MITSADSASAALRSLCICACTCRIHTSRNSCPQACAQRGNQTRNARAHHKQALENDMRCSSNSLHSTVGCPVRLECATHVLTQCAALEFMAPSSYVIINPASAHIEAKYCWQFHHCCLIAQHRESSAGGNRTHEKGLSKTSLLLSANHECSVRR